MLQVRRLASGLLSVHLVYRAPGTISQGPAVLVRLAYLGPPCAPGQSNILVEKRSCARNMACPALLALHA